MKHKNVKKRKFSALKGTKTGKRWSSIDRDPFFDNKSKRRRKFEDDDYIESSDEASEEFDGETPLDGEDRAEEAEEETAAEKRKKVAEAYLEKIRAIARREKEEEDEEGESDKEGERKGERDSLVAQILQQEQLEESGRVRRSIASRYYRSL